MKIEKLPKIIEALEASTKNKHSPHFFQEREIDWKIHKFLDETNDLTYTPAYTRSIEAAMELTFLLHPKTWLTIIREGMDNAEREFDYLSASDGYFTTIASAYPVHITKEALKQEFEKHPKPVPVVDPPEQI